MKTIVNTVMSLVLTCATFTVTAVDVSSMLKNHNAYGTQDNKQQQQEWLLDTEMGGELFEGDLTAIARMRWDTDGSLNSPHS